jgi:8-oxo-dGTP diphosphatase
MSEPAASVAIVRAREPRASILLIRRSERKEDSWSGHWSFPGGRRDPEDSDLLHTALRELQEECGIRLDREHMESALPPVLARRRTGPFVLVAPFVFSVDEELPAIVDHEEAVEALWVPQSTWCDPAQHGLRAIPGLPPHWLFPAIEMKHIPVWGFTYRLATEWLGLLPKDCPVEQPGFDAARRVLDFLLSHGMALKRDWETREAQPNSADRQPVRVAVVAGVIPTELVVAHFSGPGESIPAINLLEVLSDRIRVVGLAFEEYLIASPTVT